MRQREQKTHASRSLTLAEGTIAYDYSPCCKFFTMEHTHCLLSHALPHCFLFLYTCSLSSLLFLFFPQERHFLCISHGTARRVKSGSTLHSCTYIAHIQIYSHTNIRTKYDYTLFLNGSGNRDDEDEAFR